MRAIDAYYKDYEHEDPGNKYVLKELLRFVPKSGCRTLDVGCGTGSKSKHLRREGNHIVGIDISTPQIGKAKKVLDHAIIHNINNALPFRESEFDIIFSSAVLEHIFDFNSVLREMNRVLKPGGKIMIEVPNVNYWPNRLLMLLGRNLIWIGVGKHIRAFNKHHLRKSLFTVGFRDIKIIGSILPMPKTRLKIYLPFLNRVFPGLCLSLIAIAYK